MLITSNLVFSQWDRIFKDPMTKDPMTTAAAVDRLVHHAVIVEMTGPSVRGQEAKERNAMPGSISITSPTTTTTRTDDNYQPDGEM